MKLTGWKSILERLSAWCLLLLAVAWAPWWLSIIVAILLIIRLPAFYEVLAGGFVFDLLYGRPDLLVPGWQFLMTTVLVFTLIFIQELKIYTTFGRFVR